MAFTARASYTSESAAAKAMARELGLTIGGGGGWHRVYVIYEHDDRPNKELAHVRGWPNAYAFLAKVYQQKTGKPAPVCIHHYRPYLSDN